MKNLIKEHIKSFAVMEWHYTREQSSRMLLGSNLNLTKIYELVLKTCQKNVHVTTFSWRSSTLDFINPRKTSVPPSLLLNIWLPHNNQKLKLLNQNTKLINKLREAWKRIRNRSATRNLQVYAFDLQKVLPTPLGENGLLYYYRKLAVYSFTSFDLIQKQGYCFIWNETIAKRRASEISSCLLKLIELYCTTDNMEMVLFADNCPGQNKNRFVTQMILLAVMKFKNIKLIQLVFLERGNTQNENDSIHSTIEKGKKGITIFHPFQWVALVQGARKTRNYIVETMGTDNILSFET